jgi:hypothetical protein
VHLVKKPAIALLVLGIIGIVASLIGISAFVYTYHEYSGQYTGAPEYLNRPSAYDQWDRQKKEDWQRDWDRRQKQEAQQYEPSRAGHRQSALLGMFVFFLFGVASTFASVAGFCMRELRRYGLCMTGSIAVMLGTPCIVIGIPIGLWALLRLRNPEVIAAFR